MKKDAETNGWLERFEKGKSTPAIFKKMVNDYRHQCASQGRGKPRPVYKASRLEELFEQAKVKQAGKEGVMMDWFELENWYQGKKSPDKAFETKWRAAWILMTRTWKGRTQSTLSGSWS